MLIPHTAPAQKQTQESFATRLGYNGRSGTVDFGRGPVKYAFTAVDEDLAIVERR
jgi:hypothetical protein